MGVQSKLGKQGVVVCQGAVCDIRSEIHITIRRVV